MTVLGPQQVLVVAAVRLVAGGASLVEGGLMQVRLLDLVGLFAVAGQAGVDRIRAWEARASCRHGDYGSRCNLPAAPGCCTLAFSIFSACSL